MAPIVHIGRDRNFSSPTVPAPAVERLASEFASASRWRDPWKNSNFQTVVRDVLSTHPGLILIATATPLQVPPPFNEMFEPIEIGTGRGGNDGDLDVLSEESPARLRRLGLLRWGIVTLGIVLAAVPLFFLPVNRIPFQAISYVVFAFALCGLAVFAATLFAPNRDRWFIVPGALAIQHRPTRRNPTPGVTILSPRDTCLIVRHVKSGNSVQLALELWTNEENVLRRAISEREAIGTLAAWQSSHPPPSERQLKELAIH